MYVVACLSLSPIRESTASFVEYFGLNRAKQNDQSSIRRRRRRRCRAPQLVVCRRGHEDSGKRGDVERDIRQGGLGLGTIPRLFSIEQTLSLCT